MTDDEATPDSAHGSTGKKEPRRRLGAMVSVRFSPEELEIVRAAADKSGQSVSGYLRNAALRPPRPGAPAITYTAAYRADLVWHPNTPLDSPGGFGPGAGHVMTR